MYKWVFIHKNAKGKTYFETFKTQKAGKAYLKRNGWVQNKLKRYHADTVHLLKLRYDAVVKNH